MVNSPLASEASDCGTDGGVDGAVELDPVSLLNGELADEGTLFIGLAVVVVVLLVVVAASVVVVVGLLVVVCLVVVVVIFTGAIVVGLVGYVGDCS